MARQEQDREDLLAEAVALAERVSLRIAGHDEELIVGFRRDGGPSVYWGSQRVYHFNSQGQLRRAFVDPLLFKAEDGRLVSLRRQRSEQVVELIRHDLTDSEQTVLIAELRSHLDRLSDALANRHFTVIGQVPEGADLVGRVLAWLQRFAGEIAIARSPRAG